MLITHLSLVSAYFLLFPCPDCWKVAQLLFMERTVPMCASARTGPTATTSPGSARAGRDLQANSVSRVSTVTSVLSFSREGDVLENSCTNRLLNEVLMSAAQWPQAPYRIHREERAPSGQSKHKEIQWIPANWAFCSQAKVRWEKGNHFPNNWYLMSTHPALQLPQALLVLPQVWRQKR